MADHRVTHCRARYSDGHTGSGVGSARPRPRVVRMPEPTSEPETTSPATTGGPRAAGGGPVGRPRTAMLSATVGVLALVGGWTWAAAVQPGGFDGGNESISALAGPGTPHRWIMTTALVLTGLAHLVTAWALVPGRRTGRILLAAGGVATLAVAALPLLPRARARRRSTPPSPRCRSRCSRCGRGFAARPDGPVALERRVAQPAAVVLALAVASLAIGLGGAALGVHERVVAFLTVAWPLVTAVGAVVVGRAPGRLATPAARARRRRAGPGLQRRGHLGHGGRPSHRPDPSLPGERGPRSQPAAHR